MSKFSKIKERLASLLIEVEFATVKTEKAVLEYDGEELVEGTKVYVIDEETNERVAAADGEYTTEDNKVITVSNGEVVSIVEKEEEPTEEPVEEELVDEEPVEEPKETEPTEIEKIREEINELYKLIDSILDKIGETRKEADERLSKIEKMSAAAPAVTEIEGEIKLSAISDKRAKRLAEMNKDWRNL